MNSQKLLSALNSIPVSELERADWIAVGMALKEEGYDCAVWDEWSKADNRYHSGECARIWDGFHGSDKPVKGGTIVELARKYGWSSHDKGDGCLDWDDEIEYDGDDFTDYTMPDEWDPVGDLIAYLELLFSPDDHVGYVTDDVWQNQDGKWVPSKGAYDRTAGELIESLKAHPDDIGATIGDWKKEAGAWIRFNALDGEGVKNDNVVSYKYALVESDKIPVSDQDALYRKLELPITALVHSGGKSLHAIVRVDASNYQEYRKRVETLYDFLKQNGLEVDTQNRNPSRLSRMPGVTRNGNHQYLVAMNIGRKSWDDWISCTSGVSNGLPKIVPFSYYLANPPVLPPALIDGVLRVGHKMLLSAASKAGKSFMLMELCMAIANGTKWLGLQCRPGNVLYINLEIDENSAADRLLKIKNALSLPMKDDHHLDLWNLRGFAVPMNDLTPALVHEAADMHYDAVVIDPIYKVITGDENNASEMGAFCNEFDKICTALGSSVIYCHHHSKGAQGNKKAMDRASGSGVFARDPDAQLDVIELEMTDDIRNNLRDNHATAWRMEMSLREFAPMSPINFWFEYPIHKLDENGELAKLYPAGSTDVNLSKSPKRTTLEDRLQSIDTAYQACSIEQPVTVKSIAEYLNVTERCVRDRLKECSDKYWCKGGLVGERNQPDNG